MKTSSYHKVNCTNLILGMYVAKLDRPWVQTPFPVDGFPIRTVDELKNLSKYCKFVYVDPTRGKTPAKTKIRDMTILSSARKNSPTAAALNIRRDVYKKTKPLKKEIDTVKSLYDKLVTEFKKSQEDIKAEKNLSSIAISAIAGEITKSIIRNPDAFVWHLIADKRNHFSLFQSVGAAIWATVFARHVGYSELEMKTLLVGTLLADIGMTKLPEQLVKKTGPFRRKEYLAYRKHIRLGMDIVKQDKDLEKGALSIIKNHHERHDGLGFPAKLKGDQIPVLARIANLAYSFEKLLHSSGSHQALSPAAAIGKLYKQRKIKFQDQLVCEFIQAIGMYPTGSLVELSSKEVGIVTEQDAEQKLSPRVILVTDKDKNKRKKNPFVDLRKSNSNNNGPSISRGLDTGSYGVNPKEFDEIIFGKKLGLGRLGFRL